MATLRDPLALPSRAQEAIWLSIILVIAIGLRFFTLGDLPLWLDEAWTYDLSQLSIRDLLYTLTVSDAHPPIFFVIEHLVLMIDDTEAALRFLPALFGVVSVLVIYLIGRRFFNPVCGIAAAALLATSAVHIRYSQEARSYTLLFLELCIAVYAVLAFINSERERSRSGEHIQFGQALRAPAIFAISILAALYTHYIALFYVIGLNLVVLFAWQPMKVVKFYPLCIWSGLQVVALGLWMPQLFVVLDQMSAESFIWLYQFSFGEMLRTLFSTYGFTYYGTPPYVLKLAGIGLFFSMLWGIGATIRGKNRPVAIVAFTLLIAVPGIIWLAGFLKPMFMERTILAGLVGGALGFGAIAAVIQARFAAVLLIVMFAGNAASLNQYFGNFEKEDWDKLVEDVVAVGDQKDLVILCADFVYHPFAYYLRETRSKFDIVGWTRPPNQLVDLNGIWDEYWLHGNRPLNLTPDYQEIFVIRSHCLDQDWTALTKLIDSVGYSISAPVSRRYAGIQMYRYKPPAAPQ